MVKCDFYNLLFIYSNLIHFCFRIRVCFLSKFLLWKPDRNHRAVACFPRWKRTDSLKELIKMASQEESVREFVAVTGVEEERARFFLESAGWNLQVRLVRVSPPSSWRAGRLSVRRKPRLSVGRAARRLIVFACVSSNLCKSFFDLAAFRHPQRGCQTII